MKKLTKEELIQKCIESEVKTNLEAFDKSFIENHREEFIKFYNNPELTIEQLEACLKANRASLKAHKLRKKAFKLLNY